MRKFQALLLALAVIALAHVGSASPQLPIAQQAYLKASNAEAADFFGVAAISGNTVVIGAPYEDSNATGVNGDQTNNSTASSGAAYVFVRTGTTWSQQAYLKASNGGGLFGIAVAISGDTILVGAPYESGGSFASGAVYVFARSGANWAQQAYLKASNQGTTDFFGSQVALSGDTAVVGAPAEDSNATGVNGDQANDHAANSGAAYVFVRTGTVWSQQAYLKASNTGSGDSFGKVAIAGDKIVIGAPLEDSGATSVNGDQANNSVTDSGAAYVFSRSGTAWSQQAYLKASNNVFGFGAEFGRSVAIAEDTAVVGAPHESSLVTDSGATYVFHYGGIDWIQQALLKASNPDYQDLFGSVIAISGATVAIGAPEESSAATGVNGDESDNSKAGAGAAYVFLRSGTAWPQLAYIKASNTGQSDRFGSAISVDGDAILVGAPYEKSNATGVNGNEADNSAPAAGACYIFDGYCPLASAISRNSGSNPSSLSCSAPVLGTTWTSAVDLSITNHSSAFLYAFALGATTSLPGGQVLLGSAQVARLGPVAGPMASFSFTVPNSIALCGLHITTQALHFGGVQPFATSNAMDLVVGQ